MFDPLFLMQALLKRMFFGVLRYVFIFIGTVGFGAYALSSHAQDISRVSSDFKLFFEKVLSGVSTSQSAVASSGGNIEVAFSPNQGAEELVLKVIRSARQEIKVLAYSFTSARITQSLLAAQKSGVNVSLVVDENHNASQDKAISALSALKESGADVRVIDAYAIHHDKVIIVDGVTVQTGSFNYSAAAAKSNSENVIVLWDNKGLANIYTQRFQHNYRLAKPFEGRRR